MIQRNNNLSVLPFYTNVDEQNHRRPYAYGEVYPLFSQAGFLNKEIIIKEQHNCRSTDYWEKQNKHK